MILRWKCASVYDGKGLAYWLSCVLCFIVVLSLSDMVPWVRCGTRSYRFLIFDFLFTLCMKFRFVELFTSRMLQTKVLICCLIAS